MTYDGRLTIGLIAVLLGSLVASLGTLILWLSEKRNGRGYVVLGLAMVALGVWIIFVVDGGVPK